MNTRPIRTLYSTVLSVLCLAIMHASIFASAPRVGKANESVTSTPSSLDAILTPYTGPTQKPEENTTINGKVMAGYQGWFRTPEDGSGMGFFHWGGGLRKTPPRCTVDFWPDLSEFDPDERFATTFKHRDGRVAEVFSSVNRKTVVRHFKWMKDYGMDGEFVQRFGSAISRLMRCQNT